MPSAAGCQYSLGWHWGWFSVPSNGIQPRSSLGLGKGCDGLCGFCQAVPQQAGLMPGGDGLLADLQHARTLGDSHLPPTPNFLALLVRSDQQSGPMWSLCFHLYMVSRVSTLWSVWKCMVFTWAFCLLLDYHTIPKEEDHRTALVEVSS